MIKIKRLFLESPPASLHIIGAIYLLPSLLLYFVSEDLKFALLLEGYTFFESLRNIWLPSAEFLNEGGLFRPIVSTINLIDYSLWGTNAFGYHLTNAVVHLVNIQLVYHFSLRLFKIVDISFLCFVSIFLRVLKAIPGVMPTTITYHNKYMQLTSNHMRACDACLGRVSLLS